VSPRTLSLCFVLSSFLGNLAGVLVSPGCYSLVVFCAFVRFRRVVSWRSVSLIGLLRSFPLCLRRFLFFCLNLWRRGSIPRRSWRLDAPPFIANPFHDIACLCLGGGLDVMSESHCTNPTGGLLIRLKHKKNKLKIT